MQSVSADFEHEIPNGSRLYFGESAALKREIENTASQILTNNEFNEISTPYFSYHQHLSVLAKDLLRFSDPINHDICLRADSTVDVVRIVKRRIKNSELKRWFYVQPIFKYPSKEHYQIGAELISESNLSLAINIAKEIFSKFSLRPVLQISNIEIPKTICQILDIPISVFEKGDIEILLNRESWLKDIAKITSFAEIKMVKNDLPKELIPSLNRVLELGDLISYDNIAISLLYYSKMRYYDKMFFRFLNESSVLCSGGNYELDGDMSSGFAIMIDELIQNIMNKKDI